MSVLRQTLGNALAGGAQALNLASKLLDATARTLRPRDEAPPGRAPERPGTAPRAEAPPAAAVIAAVDDDVAARRGRVVEPPATPLLDETPHVRTSESHISELAEQPVGQVVAAVADLSTDELRLLTEHEMSHRNRRTVLAAIEKALAPDLAPPSTNGGGTRNARSGGATRKGAARSGSTRGGKTRGADREIVLPEAGGVPTSGTIDPSR